MLQLKTFDIPGEVEEANAFMRTHRPEGEIMIGDGVMKIFYQDGVYGPADEIGELNGLLMSCHNTKTQQQVAVAVLTNEASPFAEAAAKYKEKIAEVEAVGAEISELTKQIGQLSGKSNKAAREERLEVLRELTAKKAALVDEIKALEADAAKFHELETALAGALERISNQEVKLAYLNTRIAELKAQLPKEEHDNDEGTDE